MWTQITRSRCKMDGETGKKKDEQEALETERDMAERDGQSQWIDDPEMTPEEATDSQESKDEDASADEEIEGENCTKPRDKQPLARWKGVPWQAAATGSEQS